MADEHSDQDSQRFRPEISRRMPDFHSISHTGQGNQRADTGKQLIVGRDIELNGEIATCDKLVVEGSVQAKLANSKVVEVAESGTFKGEAEIDDAVIAGRFEGTLTVRGLLSVTGSGRVSGNIRYGRLAVETGGEITGNIEKIGEPAAGGGAA
jgi:cytoskeletal protein CcmA (bactofilin family)